MARGINRVVLTGNLTRDVEMRSTGSGVAVATMGIAVNDRIKRGGEWQDHVDFFDVTVFGSQAENCSRYLSKGRMVAVAGKLRQERWEKDGRNHSKVVVIADDVQFLADGRSGGERSGQDGGGYSMERETGSSAASGDGFTMEPAATPAAADDDIPF